MAKKKKWIAGAIKKPGSLTAAAKRKDMSILVQLLKEDVT